MCLIYFTSVFYARSHGFHGPPTGFAGRVRVVDFDSISHFSRVSFDVMSKKPEQTRNVPPKSMSNELCRSTGQRRDGMTPFGLRGKMGGEVNNPSRRSSIPQRIPVKYHTIVKRSLVYDRRRSNCGGFSRSTTATIADVTVHFNITEDQKSMWLFTITYLPSIIVKI